jgi:hypothetical protein
MKVAIHQPNFLPWIGYFNKIRQVDKFVFLDDVQFERGKTFTSRTKILVQGKEFWMTVPVNNKSALMNISDIQVDSSFIWKKKQLKTLMLSYKKAPFFDEVFSIIDLVYSQKSTFLIDYNIPLIENICTYLGFRIEFKRSSEIINQDKSAIGMEKILDILLNTEATRYVSGSGVGSKRYINEPLLNKNGIELEWQNFEMMQYPRINNTEFISHLSIIDLLFNCGINSVKYL